MPLDVSRLDETGELGRALISGLPGAGLLVVDADLRILLVDGELYCDLDRDAVMLRSVPDVLSPGDWAALKPHYEAALTGEAQSFEYEAQTRDATYWVRLAAIRDTHGTVTGMMVLSQDVSVKAAARRQLRRSERLQGSILDALEEGVLVVGVDGELRQANPAACKMLGVDLDPRRGRPGWWTPLKARRAADGSPLNVGAEVIATGEPVRDVDVEVDRSGKPPLRLSVNYLPLRSDGEAVDGLLLSFRDVTGEIQSRAALLRTQESLRDAHDVAQLSSWEWHPATGEVAVVQQLTASEGLAGTGGTLEDLISLMPEDERQAVRDRFAAFERGELDEGIERHRYDLPTGPAWLETRSRAVRDADGSLICVMGTSQDVTEQEIAQQSVAASRDFTRAALDSFPSHVAILDERGDIIMTNAAWRTFAIQNDIEPDGARQNYLAVCDAGAGEESARLAAVGLREILAGQRDEFSIEYPCHSPTEERWFLLRAAPYEGPGNARVVVAHDNVTARHCADAEIATQAALLAEVDLSVVATDLEGRVTHWNRGAERFYGWTAAEAVGRVSWELIVPDGSDWAPGTLEHLRREGHWDGEYAVRRKDGSVFPAYLRTKMILSADGTPTGMIGVSVDLSERVASQRALASIRHQGVCR